MPFIEVWVPSVHGYTPIPPSEHRQRAELVRDFYEFKPHQQEWVRGATIDGPVVREVPTLHATHGVIDEPVYLVGYHIDKEKYDWKFKKMERAFLKKLCHDWDVEQIMHEEVGKQNCPVKQSHDHHHYVPHDDHGKILHKHRDPKWSEKLLKKRVRSHYHDQGNHGEKSKNQEWGIVVKEKPKMVDIRFDDGIAQTDIPKEWITEGLDRSDRSISDARDRALLEDVLSRAKSLRETLKSIEVPDKSDELPAKGHPHEYEDKRRSVTFLEYEDKQVPTPPPTPPEPPPKDDKTTIYERALTYYEELNKDLGSSDELGFTRQKTDQELDLERRITELDLEASNLKWVCSRCGYRTPGNKDTCEMCDAKRDLEFDKEVVTEEEVTEETRRRCKTWHWVVVLGLIAITSIAVIGYFASTGFCEFGCG